MTNYQEKIHNIETGETTFRDFTAEEIAESKANGAKAKAEAAAEKELQDKVAADKASALAKLAALGLTEDEAKAVIGA